VSDKKGLFEAADKGSIFFDEISSLNMETQAKLLRVMQDREFMRLGGTETIKVNVRVIAATNTDLEELIKEKKFRQDLFFRLNVIKIELPPLRERKEDIPLLVKHFLDIYCTENNKEITSISEEVMEVFTRYEWPGNIRELENLIERAVVLTKTKLITRNSLPPFFYHTEEKQETASLSPNSTGTLKEQTQRFQKNWILEALRKSNGVQKKAAQLLGVKATTLNEMIKRMGIDINNLGG
jgi:transcriptional regulator with PAS, ATPase and Fis domain